jgi:hypothetical protein
MLKKLFVLTAFLTLALVLLPSSRLAARADGTAPPVLIIHSNGGTVHLYSAGGGGVDVRPGLSGQRIGVTRFVPGQFGRGPMLPGQQVCRPAGRRVRCFRLPARQFAVSFPPALANSPGFHVENPGGDMSVALPQRVGAVFIDAQQGNVVVEKLRGPFVIQAPNGDVRLKNVYGRGLIRTTAGNITLSGVGGDIHLATLGGAIVVLGSFAGKANVQSQSGPITWRFAKLGSGPYTFASEQGPIRLQFLPGVAAQVDAQSDNGNVYNMLPGANGAAAGQHALSVPINGGGPEITVTSSSGDITIEQVAPGAPLETAQP